mmetsp:Transcript_7223/g.15666  ORF Transcript_7223/g.15666 Transcript_7223/m.15666 type:complete len:149 (+) Transcript_7223:463-909(+)
MTRMKLTWLGNRGPEKETSQTFKIILLIVIASIIFSGFQLLSANVSPFANSSPFATLNVLIWNDSFLYQIFMTTLSLYTIIIIARTRAYIRAKYKIPEKQCGGCEDYCCALFCQCCTVTQMACHTTDYQVISAAYCTPDGRKTTVIEV